MIPWSYEGETIKEVPAGMLAFVYQITLLLSDGTNRFYIGKKNFFSTRRKKVIGKTRRSVTVSESNWRVYNGSSDLLKSLVKDGATIIDRKILVLCETIGGASYHEARLQFEYSVLCSDNYLNKWINVRVTRCY